MATVHTKSNPALFDKLIEEVGVALDNNLSFLDNIYGSVERVTRKAQNGRTETLPCWPMKNNDYFLISPDDKNIGNMAFFVLDEPMDVRDERYEVRFSLIIWGDMRRIYSERNVEAAKEAVLAVLERFKPRNGRLFIERVYDRATSVFQGFSFDETKNMFMMQPFFGLRFTGTMRRNRVCY